MAPVPQPTSKNRSPLPRGAPSTAACSTHSTSSSVSGRGMSVGGATWFVSALGSGGGGFR